MRQQDDDRRGRHVVSARNVHLVFVTSYRRRVLTGEHPDALRDVFANVCADVGATLVEMDGEDDHVHLLVAYPPQVAVARLVNSLNGLITNGKFCCTRRVRLRLTWWHRPLRLRRSGLETDAVLVGAPHDPDLDRLPPAQPPPRRRPPLGSGLPAAGALDGRTMRRHPAGGADGPGGA